MLVSAKALVEVGSFDESLFAYAEDTGLVASLRARGPQDPRRSGECRTACRVRLVRRSVVAGHALLRRFATGSW